MTTVAEPPVAASTHDADVYQTFLTVRGGDDLVKRVEEQLEDWLRKKKNWDPPTETSGFHRGPKQRELLILHRRSGEGRDFRARLREPNKLGTWTTTVTVHESLRGDSWVGLRVSNSAGRYVAVPRLATFLVDALEARDGDTWLSSTPRTIHEPGVEAFAEELGNFDRKGLYFVAGTAPDPQVDAFVERVGRCTRETVGLAQVAVLDPAATQAFNEIMGPDHSARPWTIRTYRPDVDPAIASDGRRHRILGSARLQEPDEAVARLLGRVARRHAAEQPKPDRFVAVDRALTRLEDEQLLDALHVEPTGPVVQAPQDGSPAGAVGRTAPEPEEVADAAAAYLAQVELAKSTLGVDDLTPETLDEVARLMSRGRADAEAVDRVTRRLEERRERIDALEGELAHYVKLNDIFECDLADATDQLAKAADENRWLRARLRSLEDYETAAAALPSAESTAYPADFVALADRLDAGEPDAVVFTGDLKKVRSLDDHDTLGRIAQVAWEALLTLADYVRARNTGACDQGVKHYLRHTPPGFRSLPPNKFAERESSATMNAWGDLRTFAVPPEVDADGVAVMEAHFKLGKVGMVSPRLYYLDHWTVSRKVYVGYIGDHPRNTKTR